MICSPHQSTTDQYFCKYLSIFGSSQVRAWLAGRHGRGTLRGVLSGWHRARHDPSAKSNPFNW